jgi:hypothetical protein
MIVAFLQHKAPKQAGLKITRATIKRQISSHPIPSHPAPSPKYRARDQDSPEELEMTLVRIGERGKGKDGIEWKFLYRIGRKTKIPPKEPYPLSEAVRYLAEPGNYRRAPSDGPPGLKSVWQGLFRLFEMVEILVDQV